MLNFSNLKCVDTVNRIAPNLPTALIYRQSGKRGGKNRKTPVQKNLCLPSLVLANARSVNNKTDELIALIKYHYAYKNASAIDITETWLHGDIDDSHVEVNGFDIFSADRDVTKHVAEGVCGLLEKPGAQTHQSTGVSYLKTWSSYTLSVDHISSPENSM